ncbi:MAG: GldG family protein [Brevinematales bacterium]|nr:GldG family protein [Brevinematales bacterium]
MEKLKKYSLFLIPIILLLSIIFYIIWGAYSIYTQIFFVSAFIILIAIGIINYKTLLEIAQKTSSIKKFLFLTQFAFLFGGLVFSYLFLSTINFKIDFTKERLYSLSSETTKILKNLTNDVNIYFFKPSSMSDPVLDYIDNLLKRYKEKSTHIKLKTVDPIQNRTMALDYDVKENGSIVFETDKGKIIVSPRKVIDQNMETGEIYYKGEEAFTKAIKNLTLYKPRNVYVLQGHGEINPFDKSFYGFRTLFELLQQENIKLRELNLLKTPEIPPECNLIIIGNPRNDLSPEELDRINLFLDNGGNLLLLLEYETTFTLNDILSKAGVFYLENLVVEDEGYLPQLGRTTIVPNFIDHEITKNLINNRKIIIMPTTVAILEMPEKDKNYNFEIFPLLSTSKSAWGEVSKEEIKANKVKYDKKDLKGPLNLAYVIKRKLNNFESRIGIIGDSDFVNNANVDKYSNFEFFMNLINYLLGREEEVGISPKISGIKPFRLSGTEKRLLQILAFIPLIIFILPGIFVIIQRKRLYKSKDNQSMEER